MKKFLGIVATITALIGLVWVCMGTNLVVENTRTFKQWAQRYEAIEAGTYQPPALVSGTDTEALRDDFVSLLEKQQEDLFQKLLHRAHSASDGPLARREQATLYLTDLEPYAGAPVDSTASAWREGISEYWKSSWTDKYSESQRVELAFVAINFDEMDIGEAVDGFQRIDLKEMRPEGLK